MEIVQGVGDLDAELHGALDAGQGRRLGVGERTTLDELGNQHGAAPWIGEEIDHPGHAIAAHAPEQHGLALEALDHFGIRRHLGEQHLQRDAHPRCGVHAGPHLAHAALGDGPLDPEPTPDEQTGRRFRESTVQRPSSTHVRRSRARG